MKTADADIISILKQIQAGGGGGGGGATIPSTTNLISGDGSGNGSDSGIDPNNVLQVGYVPSNASVPRTAIDETQIPVAEASTITLALGGIYGSTASGTLTTIVFSGTPASSQPETVLRIIVTSGPYTITVPTARRLSDSGTTTSLVLPTGNHLVFWFYDGTQYWMGDTTTEVTVTPTALSGNVNNYSPTGLSYASVLRIDGGASDRIITGLDASTSADGRVIGLINIGSSNKLTLPNQSGSSSAANQFLLPADVDIPINTAIALRRDGISSRWRPFSRALSNTGVTAGSYGSGTAIPVVTFDAQGRATAASTASVTGLSGTNTGDQNLFSTIAVSGQSDVVADSATDTLTLAAGSNITLTTNASTDTVTITGSAGGSGGGVIAYSAPSLTLTANTYYAPPGGGGTPSTTEASSQVASAGAATISNFRVTVSAAPGVGNSYAFTWRKAGSDQTVTCTISDTATSASDTTHSFTVAAGDLIDVKIVSTGTIVTTPMVSWLAQYGGSLYSVASDPIFDAKGDLAIGTGADASAKLSAGTDGHILIYDSSQTTGLRAAAARIFSDAPVGVPFVYAATGINLKTAATTDAFTVPAGKTFVCQTAVAVVTAVTGAGAGTLTYQIIESGSNGAMTVATASGSATPSITPGGANAYTEIPATTTGPWSTCAAGNKVQVKVNTSNAGSTTVTGTVYITGFYY